MVVPWCKAVDGAEMASPVSEYQVEISLKNDHKVRHRRCLAFFYFAKQPAPHLQRDLCGIMLDLMRIQNTEVKLVKGWELLLRVNRSVKCGRFKSLIYTVHCDHCSTIVQCTVVLSI